MKFIRQVLLALSIAAAVAAVLRTKSTPVITSEQGGWREVTPQR